MSGDWLNTMNAVGGRLVPAARNFLDSQHPPSPGNGSAGVRWLASQLEDFVDQDSDGTQDDRFVEGAGAVLGLLLIQHLGGRSREHEGAHRVQLGRFGYFDPFGAIQEALDAENPRACLAEYLTVAEREAKGDGPVSRVVRVFADALGRERPDIGIESQFELSVDLSNGAAVDLRSLERVARDQDDDAATEAAKRIISMLPGARTQEATPWNEAAGRLLPRLVSEKFLDSLPDEQRLYLEPMGHDLYLSLQLRYGTRARYLRREEVEAWPLEHAAVERQAIENLAAKSRSLRLEPVAEGILRVRQGDGLDGARLLLPDLGARLVGLRPGMWIAAAPHRDVLLLGHSDAESALRERAEDAVRRAPHPVSAALFEISRRGPLPILG